MNIQPVKRLKGELTVPGDKSISHRSVMFGAIAAGQTEIEGFLPGADCLSTIACFRRLGVEIKQTSPTNLTVFGKGWDGLQEPSDILDVGNSGTTIRLMMGILASTSFHTVLLGDASIGRRPMKRVVAPLKEMGAKIDGRADGQFTPLAVRGTHLTGIEYHSPVASAQVKSAILLAGLRAEGTTTVFEPHRSRDHTEKMLQAFGVKVEQKDTSVSIEGGQALRGQSIRVPGDISSAAFIMAAAAIVPGSEVTIRDVGVNPTRTGIIDAMLQMGANIQLSNERIWGGEPIADITVKHTPLRGTTISGEIIPRMIDEIPVFAVLATQAEGKTIIKDAEELRVKETDRVATVVSELTKLGGVVEGTPDGLVVVGASELTGCECDSFGDHRIGMAMAIAGLVASGETKITGAEAIDVSFPGFAASLQSIIE